MIIRGPLPALDERAQRRIARSALENDCAVVINVEQHLMPGVVRQLRHGGAKVALWFPDSLVNKAEVFRSAAAMLNNLRPGGIESINARLCEAAGAGAAIVTDCLDHWHRLGRAHTRREN